jgi:hypothetical protein
MSKLTDAFKAFTQALLDTEEAIPGDRLADIVEYAADNYTAPAVGEIRTGKVKLTGGSLTPVAFKDDSAASILGTEEGPFALDHGNTLIVNPDGNGNDTITFAATAGTSVSAASPSTDISGATDNKLLISVDGSDPEEIELAVAELSSGAAIATALQNAIQALTGVFAAVTVDYNVSATGKYTIKSGTKGTGSSVIITDAPNGNIAEELKLGVANEGVETAGMGDAVNIGAATAEEVAAAINEDATGWHAEAVGDKVRIVSDTEGQGSSLVVDASSTADTVLGITGSGYGAQGLGYETDMADDEYKVSAVLNGATTISGRCLSANDRTAAGFNLVCETTAATDDVDLVIFG